MRVNTELMEKKFQKIKVARLLSWFFARLTIYLRARYLLYIYIYIVCMEFDEWINFLLVYETDLY